MALPVVIPCIAAARYYAETPLGVTDWISITQDRIDLFADATGDHQWIHCDVERAAREAPWKSTIAHGFLLLSLVPTLLPELLVLIGWKTAINTGVDDCRFLAPVPAGSRVRMAAQLAKARTLPGGGCRLGFAVDFECEGSDASACSATVNYVYYP
ncbi:MAG: MaoC family dehydratase [Myxococcales bacterium]|nr:MaoC family dehydratase [Myxococcales bacterium]MDH5565694.1 MaoC family dehydratase [Myxococcales bacterium]